RCGDRVPLLRAVFIRHRRRVECGRRYRRDHHLAAGAAFAHPAAAPACARRVQSGAGAGGEPGFLFYLPPQERGGPDGYDLGDEMHRHFTDMIAAETTPETAATLAR